MFKVAYSKNGAIIWKSSIPEGSRIEISTVWSKFRSKIPISVGTGTKTGLESAILVETPLVAV